MAFTNCCGNRRNDLSRSLWLEGPVASDGVLQRRLVQRHHQVGATILQQAGQEYWRNRFDCRKAFHRPSFPIKTPFAALESNMHDLYSNKVAVAFAEPCRVHRRVRTRADELTEYNSGYFYFAHVTDLGFAVSCCPKRRA